MVGVDEKVAPTARSSCAVSKSSEQPDTTEPPLSATASYLSVTFAQVVVKLLTPTPAAIPIIFPLAGVEIVLSGVVSSFSSLISA